ncbi:MAG: LamG domain-containing protein [Candidatus Micrarchaeota archaeon]|nr:LamG domain-containing protein [Candidatus Micrarchaeota archaeon]
MARLQSAMEYLMTYGWAILAIAIVMVSLYSLGIFNAGSLQPTATPGSCEVVRTAAQTSLAGQCNGLIPKYVGKFNGQGGYIDAGSSSSMTVSSSLTVSIWISPGNFVPRQMFVERWYTGTGSVFSVELENSLIHFYGSTDGTYNGGCPDLNVNASLPLNTFHSIIFVFDGGVRGIYIDGVLKGSSSSCGSTLYHGSSQDNLRIGGMTSGSYANVNGSMANVQVYNTSLDASTIKSLYQEGIGGVPIDIQHLVGWWPLNGNANDYSGNNNQGTPTSVVWNANWQSGYTAPTS